MSKNLNRGSKTVPQILGEIRNRGVELWCDNGQLRYRSPKGALSDDELRTLHRLKGELLTHLNGEGKPGYSARTNDVALPGGSAPLAFPQLAHWQQYRLHERPAIRQLASATRLQGELDRSALRAAVAAVFRHHDALRTRVQLNDGVPEQVVDDDGNCEIRCVDLRPLAEAEQRVELQREIERLILEPVRVERGPLAQTALFTLGQADHVLVIVLEHMISDAYSMNIVLRDLRKAYEQVQSGQPVVLTPVATQISDFARAQRSGHARWLEHHGRYWKERLAGCGRLHFPRSTDTGIAGRVGWGKLPVRIEPALKNGLEGWRRGHRTTLVMGVFAAYVALVFRWCDQTDGVVRFYTDGRTSTRLTNTVGYLASTLYLRFELLECDTFVDLVNRLVAEYCSAYEHANASFLECQNPAPAFTRNSWFNWVPKGDFQRTYWNGLDGQIECSPVVFDHPMRRQLRRDNEPIVLLYEGEEDIVGEVQFPLDQFDFDLMERFARNLIAFTEALVADPGRKVSSIPLR